ncbi:Uncharacterized protein BP5553_01787 [Venustampulla echinocandica]|uniref:Matrin-type domain-containing protein n=1 Tax=Venustampulla echinocandica TaxID=2656787 RepID=A0A370U206_9HELO|nr:Uncharacterized protein BP5553_01787 [Venustampulla echinocandica]RDL41808.1 Uncharacterized protein BP5553_01787 [Venustampulla echinocandica]
MSEYWKSTPKYWCKYCKTYVRDTKLEKQNHEATPKHQGNLKRFLRDLHRGHEKDEKDKERAKSEVARLNGLVTGGGATTVSSSSGFGRGPTPSLPKSQATPSQRKQQLAQLAELGVSIPDEFRPEMAMAGEWQVTSERVIVPDGERGPDAIALGVRKRTVEEEEEDAAETKRRRWGSAYRTHPAAEDNSDLDVLLSNATRKGAGPTTKTEVEKDANSEIKEEAKLEIDSEIKAEVKLEPENGERASDDIQGPASIKKEPSDGTLHLETAPPLSDATVKQEPQTQVAPEIVFKKRKAKNIRQK